MFSLIIAILAIILVALLAAATIYYGGDSFNKGNSKARAAEILNQAELIKGAFTAYKIEQGTIEINQAACDVLAGKFDDCLEPLVTKEYLTDIPQGAEGWYIDNEKVLRRTLKEDVKACAIANYVNGAVGMPQNPESKEFDLVDLATNNVPEFRKYVPSCATLEAGAAGIGFVCCEEDDEVN
jgi:type II secretory pathway pseudopilin PulG